MNVLRQPLRSAYYRAYATARPFVPPSQLQDLQPPFRGRPGGNPSTGGDRRHRKPRRDEPEELSKTAPVSQSFYTGRAVYYDQVIQLETAIGQARGALKTLQLLPLPPFARASLPPLRPVWKTQEEMTDDFQSRLTTGRYRRVVVLLNQLNDCLRIATTAGCLDLAQGIEQVVRMFESGKKDELLVRGKRKKVFLDQYGRSLTVGKRKTSAARVWMIPVQRQAPEPQPSDSLKDILGLPTPAMRPEVKVTATTVLVNNLPLAEYFPLPADRERIIRPLKIAGVLGAYNVFAIVRGGGTTGQSGALAHGIAKGLVAHEPTLEELLRRAKLMRRDPRMVERKKTNLAKARKAYAWVKR